MSWLTDLVQSTEEAESPSQFIFWSGLCAISAVLRKNVFLDKFYYRLYPNIYAMLIAKSGGRKGLPVSIARKLVTLTNCTRVMSGRNSVQAIIKDLSMVHTFPNGGVLEKAHAFLASPEFSNLVIDDKGALTILTDIYDTHDHELGWINTLKSTGAETLKDPYITMLGASNESHLEDRISLVDVTGGFIGRTSIIIDTSAIKVNPLTEPPKIRFDMHKFLDYLLELSKVKGEFNYSPEAKIAYEEWYREFRNALHEDSTGTAERLHDRVLKLSMLLSISRNKTLIIEKEDLAIAMELENRSLKNVRQATTGVQGSTIGTKAYKAILKAIIQSPTHSITRKNLLRRANGQFDYMQLDVAIEQLSQMKGIDVKNDKGEITYTGRSEFISQFGDEFVKAV
jgi:hypothetical protein